MYMQINMKDGTKTGKGKEKKKRTRMDKQNSKKREMTMVMTIATHAAIFGPDLTVWIVGGGTNAAPGGSPRATPSK
jgi:hypothetical protein